MNRQILNRAGFSLSEMESVRWGLIWRVTRYTYQADETAPLTYFDGVYYWKPDNRFRTDGRSIPPPLQALPGYGQFDSVNGIFHDSGYIHGGLWRAPSIHGPWIFVQLDQREMDRMYLEIGREDDQRAGAVWTQYAMLRLFGRHAWGHYREVKRLHYSQQKENV
jgi:hypothetical protein